MMEFCSLQKFWGRLNLRVFARLSSLNPYSLPGCLRGPPAAGGDPPKGAEKVVEDEREGVRTSPNPAWSKCSVHSSVAMTSHGAHVLSHGDRVCRQCGWLLGLKSAGCSWSSMTFGGTRTQSSLSACRRLSVRQTAHLCINNVQTAYNSCAPPLENVEVPVRF